MLITTTKLTNFIFKYPESINYWSKATTGTRLRVYFLGIPIYTYNEYEE